MSLQKTLAFLFSLFVLVSFSADASSLNPSSVFNLSAKWINQEGKEMELSELRGKARLITMVYTSCQYSCPMVIENIKKLLEKLPPSSASKVGVVLVSFDTERDTPLQMKKYCDKKNLDSKTWTLLRGNKTAVREMATLLGISYKKTEGEEYSHTNALTLLDPEGVIRFRQNALGSDSTDFLKSISSVIQ